MVKKREMRGQSGKKVGCPDRQWMLGREFHWAIARGKKLFLYASVELCARRKWCGYPGRGLGGRVMMRGWGTATSPCWILKNMTSLTIHRRCTNVSHCSSCSISVGELRLWNLPRVKRVARRWTISKLYVYFFMSWGSHIIEQHSSIGRTSPL